MITRVGVGIPARDEVLTISQCIESVLAAAKACEVPVHIAVVADSCSDNTAQLALRALRSTGHPTSRR